MSDADLRYAHYADNAALYLLGAQRFDESRKLNARAIELYEKFSPVSVDLAAAYSHAGDSYRDSDIKRAIEFQQKSLEVWERVESKYSERYESELGYLKNYAEKAGDEYLAKTTAAKIDLLKNGRVPHSTDVKTADEARQLTDEMLYACRYFTRHKLSANGMGQVMRFITNWAIASKDVSITVTPLISKMIDAKDGRALLLASFFAGVSEYSIVNKDRGQSLGAHVSGVVTVLNCYMNNKEAVGGESPVAEELIRAYREDQDSLFEQIRLDHEQGQKNAEEAEKGGK